MSAVEEALRVLDLLEGVARRAEDLEAMMRALNETLAPVLGAGRIGIMLHDPARDVLQMLPGSFGSPEAVTASYLIPMEETRSNAVQVFTKARTFVSNHARGDERILQGYVEAFAIERLMTAPLRIDGQAIGVMTLINHPESIGGEHLRLVRVFAPRVAMLVEHVANLVRIRRKEALESVLSRVAEAIAAGAPLDQLLSPAFDELLVITRAKRVTLTVPGAAAVVLGDEPVDGAVERAFLADARRGGRTARERLIGPREPGDPGWTTLHLPVRISDERVATLSLLRIRAEPVSRDEHDALLRLTDLAALAWATERYQQERAAMARLRERRRIADDLHDHVAQLLYGSKLALESLLEAPPEAEVDRNRLVLARDLVRRGEAAMREVIEALSDDDAQDVIGRLAAVVQLVEEQFSVRVHFDPPQAPAGPVLREATIALLVRIAREALTNAAKHAGPSRIALRVETVGTQAIRLSVLDDGIGFAGVPSEGGHGLPALQRAVREHGGELTIARGTYGGTELVALLDA